MIERLIPIAKEIARQLVPGKRVTKLLRGHAAVGCSVTATCTTRRRSWARSTRANSSRHADVGTTRSRPRSAGARGSPRRSARSARVVPGGGPCISRRSFGRPSGPASATRREFRGAPQSGFAVDIVRIRVHLLRNRRPTRPMTAPTRPEEAEPAPMPADHARSWPQSRSVDRRAVKTDIAQMATDGWAATAMVSTERAW
jgi:hypothetical protein